MNLTPERLAEKVYRFLGAGEQSGPTDEFFNVATAKWELAGSYGFTGGGALPIRRVISLTDLPAAVEEISRLQAENQKLITEVHGKYGMRHLTDQLLALTADRDTLRQQLAEAKEKLERAQQDYSDLLVDSTQACMNLKAHADAILDDQPINGEYVHTVTCNASRKEPVGNDMCSCGIGRRIQQANAASGEDTKRLDWLGEHQVGVLTWTADGPTDGSQRFGFIVETAGIELARDNARAAIDAAMEGSRTK